MIMALFFVANTSYAQNNKKKSNICEVTYFVPGIDCATCKKKIESRMPYVKGVKDLKVSLEKKTVWIKYDSSKVTREKLSEELAKTGFPGKENKENKDNKERK
jgi:Copper chaperone